ncbi:MAG: hypothetical protein ACI4I3_06910 [Acutalibacteraceae bacterium]
MKKPKQIMLGILIPLAVWIIGILSCGSIFLGDELDFSDGFLPLKAIYPIIIAAYAIVSALVARKKDLPHFFKASQAILIIPILSYILLILIDYLSRALGNPSFIEIIILILMFLTPPIVSVIFGVDMVFDFPALMIISIILIAASIIAGFLIFNLNRSHQKAEQKPETVKIEEKDNNSDLQK